MRTTRSALIGVAILSICLRASSAQADALIDFGTGSSGKGGTISFAGGSSPLVGTGIRIGVVTGVDTPVHEDSHLVTGNGVSYGTLNFTTGAYQGYSAGSYWFAGGGSFEIWGNVADAGIFGAGAGQLLFSGTFETASVGSVGSLRMLSASGTDTYENPLLTGYFGLGPGTLFDFSSYVMAMGSIGAGTPFSIAAFSTDWANPDPPLEGSAVTTPEPGPLMLLASGLAFLALMTQRRALAVPSRSLR